MNDDLDWQAWVGREEHQRQTIDAAPAAALAATLDLPRAPGLGDPLPPGWQWLFFNPVVRAGLLGEDGHPLRTPDSFLPPLSLPRRMWAGSRVRYLAPLRVGAGATRSSRIERVLPKEGRSGRMCFVTVTHRTASEGRDCIVEEQDIVYREASAGAAPVPLEVQYPAAVQAACSRTVAPDAVMLFRYSALTFNGHRIHYDRSYARDLEHYRDRVVHGPLTATLLQALAVDCRSAETLASFEFKGLQPLFADQPVVLCADADPQDPGALLLKAVAPDGATAMQATARFADGGARYA